MKNTGTKIVKTEQAAIVPASPADLLQLAIEKDVDIDKLEKLLAMVERWEDRQAKKAYYSSLSKFQFECPPILKSKAGYADRYHYAPLDQIIKIIKNPMFNNGLTYTWKQKETDKQITVTCIITHVAGHSEETSLSGDDDTSGSKNAIQARGSTVQYLRRYTLESVLGIATSATDTDGGQTPKKVSITKEQSSELLAKAKIRIDEFEKSTELQEKGRPILQEQVDSGLNAKDKKELTSYITDKYNELVTEETKADEYVKNL